MKEFHKIILDELWKIRYSMEDHFGLELLDAANEIGVKAETLLEALRKAEKEGIVERVFGSACDYFIPKRRNGKMEANEVDKIEIPEDDMGDRVESRVTVHHKDCFGEECFSLIRDGWVVTEIEESSDHDFIRCVWVRW